jgi:hypothetical protein
MPAIWWLKDNTNKKSFPPIGEKLFKMDFQLKFLKNKFGVF